MASFLARSGREWATLVGTLNSGTGNNQWMAVDLNLFKVGGGVGVGLGGGPGPLSGRWVG